VTPSRSARYVVVRDGTRLALDLWLPGPPAAGPWPVVLRATRYWRLEDPGEAEAMAAAGIALALLDARGSGASFGIWEAGWPDREVDDLEDVVAWLAAQPWCTGRVGVYGVSYDGDYAEVLATRRPPALRAAALLFSDFDASQLMAPGGVPIRRFTDVWAQELDRLDRLAPDPELPPEDPLATAAGVRRRLQVDEDPDGSLLDAALAGRPAPDFRRVAADRGGGWHADPRRRWAAAGESRDPGDLALAVVVSWFDAGTAAGALQRFDALSHVPQELLICATAHGGESDASPYGTPGGAAAPAPEELRAALVAFFARTLRDGPRLAPRHTIEYRVLGAEGWRRTASWPPAGTVGERLRLHPDGRLGAEPAAGVLNLRGDRASTTGSDSNRWATQVGRSAVVYPDRPAQCARGLTFDMPPLEAGVELTGAATVRLAVRAEHRPAAVFAYLDDVAPDGTVRYLTEGVQRLPEPGPDTSTPPALPPAASPPPAAVTLPIALLPVAALLRRGHALRLTLTLFDAGTFDPLPATGEVEVALALALDGCSLELPLRAPEPVCAHPEFGHPRGTDVPCPS
jgi:uncharacterized protein